MSCNLDVRGFLNLLNIEKNKMFWLLFIPGFCGLFSKFEDRVLGWEFLKYPTNFQNGVCLIFSFLIR